MDRVARIMELLKATPDDSFLQHALALERIKTGDDAEARQIFEGILLREPAYVGSYYHLGKLLERMGEMKAAIGWYERGMAVAQSLADFHALGELRAAYEDLVD